MDILTRGPIRFLAGPSEKLRFIGCNLLSVFDEEFAILGKLRYVEFLPVLSGARFVVTGSGGVQEEYAYSGTPVPPAFRRKGSATC